MFVSAGAGENNNAGAGAGAGGDGGGGARWGFVVAEVSWLNDRQASMTSGQRRNRFLYGSALQAKRYQSL